MEEIPGTYELLGPVPHRVYQRDASGTADIPFELVFSQATAGTVEIRLVSAAGDMPWTTAGAADGRSFRAAFRAVPAGGHRLEFRVEAGGAWKAIAVDPVFVGDLWVLAGQSNMEGCGKLIDTEPPAPGVSCFGMDEQWSMAADPLCWLNESADPVHWLVPENERPAAIADARRDRTEAAGLGVAFGKELLRHTGIPVGLIMCARGATESAQWDPSLAHLEGRSLYGAMLRRIRKLGGSVKGCCWYQGESDALAQASAGYRERLLRIVESLRRDVRDPQLAFIYAQLSVFYQWQPDDGHWNRVQQEQLEAEALLGSAALVPTIDAGMSNAIHLDAPSLIAVGRRMAWQALRLAYGTAAASTGPRIARADWDAGRVALSLTLEGTNGRLVPVKRVYGFYAEADGRPLPLTGRLNADRTGIVLRFDAPVPTGCRLWHGKGTNPTVNVKDEMGIPLVVFGPIEV